MAKKVYDIVAYQDDSLHTAVKKSLRAVDVNTAIDHVKAIYPGRTVVTKKEFVPIAKRKFKEAAKGLKNVGKKEKVLELL